MFVFISYTKETENLPKCVRKLSKTLRKSYDVFLDCEDINPTKNWREQIDAAIKKADVFVIFFSKEYLTKVNEKYILGELENIKYSCERRKEEGRAFHVIPILFDSIKAEELPEFFQDYQAITNKGCEATIVIIRETLATKKTPMVTWAALTTSIAIIGFLLLINFIDLDITKAGPDVSINKLDIEIACESSGIENYVLYQTYVFKDLNESRVVAKAHKAHWKDVTCNDMGGNKIKFEGEDETIFEIQRVIGQKFETIATVKYNYPSTVILDKNLTSGERTFGQSKQDYIDKENNQLKNPSERKEHEIITYISENKKRESLFISDEDRTRIITDAIKELNENFHNHQQNGCNVMFGPIDEKMAFAFVCSGDPKGVGYTRIMVKK